MIDPEFSIDPDKLILGYMHRDNSHGFIKLLQKDGFNIEPLFPEDAHCLELTLYKPDQDEYANYTWIRNAMREEIGSRKILFMCMTYDAKTMFIIFKKSKQDQGDRTGVPANSNEGTKNG